MIRNPQPGAREFSSHQSLHYSMTLIHIEPWELAAISFTVPLMMTLILWEQQAARND